MKESDLYVPVRDWLTKHGYEIHVEIFDADIVALKDGKITVVELKRYFSHDLYMQLYNRATWADYVMAAVPVIPRAINKSDSGIVSLRDYRVSGFGLLCVIDGVVRQKIKPRPQPWGWHKKREYRLAKLTGRAPAMAHEVAGLPACEQVKKQRKLRDNPSLITEGWIDVIKTAKI